ncbi:hypothetical protein T484DRAFT_1828042, partial [Baffinella frigidus]
MAIYTPDSATQLARVAADISDANGRLGPLGVTAVAGNGVSASAPPPPPAWEEPASDRHLYLADEYIRSSVESAVSTVGACYGLGIGITFFKEMQHAYWYIMEEASRGSMVGEALATLEQTTLHQGLGLRAGGAFRSLVHQAQFIALMGEIGGRYGSATRGRYIFDVGNESVYPGLGTRGHPYYPPALFNTTLPASDPLRARNESLVEWALLPLGPRELSRALEWTNFRVNLTDALKDGDVLPRTCDVFAQQMVLGTFFTCLLTFVLTFLVRSAIKKAVEVSAVRTFGHAVKTDNMHCPTWKIVFFFFFFFLLFFFFVFLSKVYAVRTFGHAVKTDNMHFPTWEIVVFAWFFTGLSQASGTGLGSPCGDWIAGGVVILVLPVALTIFTFFCAELGSPCGDWIAGGVVILVLPVALMIFTIVGRWVRTKHDDDYTIDTWKDKFYDRTTYVFREFHGARLAPYYPVLQLVSTLAVAITSSASLDPLASGVVFAVVYGLDILTVVYGFYLVVVLVVYGLDFVVVLHTQPYRDRCRNIVEVVASAARAAAVAIGLLHIFDPSILGAPRTEVWESFIYLYKTVVRPLFSRAAALHKSQVGESFIYLYLTVVRPLFSLGRIVKGHHAKQEEVTPGKGTIGFMRSESDAQMALVETSLSYKLHHQNEKDVYATLEVRLEGASGLGAKDLTKNAAVCMVKRCGEHVPHFDNRDGHAFDEFHGDTVYQTKCGGHTLTATSAWWNE